MIKVAIIGFGGIAHGAHLPAYAHLLQEKKAELVAVCDIDPAQFEKKAELNIGGEDVDLGATLRRYTDWREMIAAERPDMVDICLPTFLHAEVAIGAMELGCHVLSEKPMSLNFADCRRMCDTAKATGKYLMVAQCLRFSGAYAFLKGVVAENTYGKALGGVFRRLSGPPVWGWNNWFCDENRSGGCLLDMHIHDLDIIRYLFGEPRAVNCTAADLYSGKDIVHSQLHFDGFSMLAIGDWSQKGLPFTADYRLAFEKATVDLSNGKITVYPREGEPFEPEFDQSNMYANEIEFFVNLLTTGATNEKNPPESAACSVKLVEALRESAKQGGVRVPFAGE